MMQNNLFVIILALFCNFSKFLTHSMPIIKMSCENNNSLSQCDVGRHLLPLSGLVPNANVMDIGPAHRNSNFCFSLAFLPNFTFLTLCLQISMGLDEFVSKNKS